MATGTTSISIELYAANAVLVYNIDSLEGVLMSSGYIDFYTGKFSNGGKDRVIFSGNYLVKYTERKEV
jgi:hypothetical protein